MCQQPPLRSPEREHPILVANGPLSKEAATGGVQINNCEVPEQRRDPPIQSTPRSWILMGANLGRYD